MNMNNNTCNNNSSNNDNIIRVKLEQEQDTREELRAHIKQLLKDYRSRLTKKAYPHIYKEGN